ncbi:MAG: PIN domain-containing protein, partial [Desulfobacterales bacterium]
MMAIQKHYVIDTNVLLEDPNALSKLRNGNENQIYIPYHVLLELNKFKKSPKLGHIVSRVVQYLNDNPDHYKILNASGVAGAYAGLVDNFILKEILNSGLKKPILVTNDKIFQLQAALQGVKSEIYKESVPFKSEAEYFTGFVSAEEDTVPNAFRWNEHGKPVFCGVQGEKLIDYQHKIWNLTPRTIFQNLALELMVNHDIHILSIQSDAGYGKSFLALAAA